MAPIASFSGLASGIQWRDMIDQIMQLEKTRRLNPVTNRIKLQKNRNTAWSDYNSLVTKLRDASKLFSEGSALRTFKATASSNVASGRALISASASETAAAGTYNVEVLQLAKAEKLGSAEVTDAAAALNLAGTFHVNGRAVTLASGDSLTALRDKINAANTGSNASGVTATILTTSSNSHRLILTADNTGSRGVELVDSDTGVLKSAALGVLSGTQTTNASTEESGWTDSIRYSSRSEVLKDVLGVSPPPAVSTILVGGVKVEVDFNSDTLDSVLAKIKAADPNAKMREEVVNGKTMYRLSTSASVAVDPASAESQRNLELLGFVKNSAASQIAAGSDAKFQIDNYSLTRRTNTVTDAIQGVTIDLLATDAASRTSSVTGTLAIAADPKSIDAGTYSVDVTSAATLGAVTGSGFDGAYNAATATPDWIEITDASGKVSRVDLTTNDNLNKVLKSLNDSFAANGVQVQAVDSGGQVRLESTATAGSGASFTVTSSSGSVQTNLGIADGTYSGVDMKVSIGGEAAVWDPSTSTISGATGSAFEGLKLTYSGAGAVGKIGDLTVEGDISVELKIERDTEESVKKVEEFVKLYNEVSEFVKKQRDTTGPLGTDSSLRSMFGSLRDVLFSDVTGLSATNPYTRLSLVGVEYTRGGTLEMDSTAFKNALTSGSADVEELFAGVGAMMESAADAMADSVDGSIKLYQDTIGSSISGLERRQLNIEAQLERRRESLVKQFTAMEEAMSRIQSQGSWLTSQLAGLSPQ